MKKPATQPDLFGGPTIKVGAFEKDGLGFIKKFARKHRGRPFSAEDVTRAAMANGIAPQDLRAWGPLFTQAAKDGHIKRSDMTYRRSMGNGSLAVGWVSA